MLLNFAVNGHRVRLATHANFKDSVLTAGLEFFPLGGDPKDLAEWHSHVADALKIPIHIFFTMPWTPTSEFPHPLSRVEQHIGYRIGVLRLTSLGFVFLTLLQIMNLLIHL